MLGPAIEQVTSECREREQRIENVEKCLGLGLGSSERFGFGA